MSNKSAQKGKKLSVPRSLEDINKEYGTTAFNAGRVQYQIKVYQGELDQLNNRLLELNHEAANRQKLDAPTEQATVALPKEETANVQS